MRKISAAHVNTLGPTSGNGETCDFIKAWCCFLLLIFLIFYNLIHDFFNKSIGPNVMNNQYMKQKLVQFARKILGV
jgi:hypothetical protein